MALSIRKTGSLISSPGLLNYFLSSSRAFLQASQHPQEEQLPEHPEHFFFFCDFGV